MEVNDEVDGRGKAVDAFPASSVHVDHDSLMKSLPVGYRFKPSDHQLLIFLEKKLCNQALPPSPIVEVNIYEYNPDFLAEKFGRQGEKELYFFTARGKRYANGDRPSRTAGDGYWRCTSGDKDISCSGVKIGSKKALAFYMGRPSTKGVSTSWFMYEYTLKKITQTPPNSAKLDDLFLCKIYKKYKKELRERPRKLVVDVCRGENGETGMNFDEISMPIAEAKYNTAMPQFGPCHGINTAPLSLEYYPAASNHSNEANMMETSINPNGGEAASV